MSNYDVSSNNLLAGMASKISSSKVAAKVTTSVINQIQDNQEDQGEALVDMINQSTQALESFIGTNIDVFA